MLSYLALVLDVECFVINVSCLYLLLRPRNIPNVRSFLISLSFYIFFVTHFKSTKLHFSKNDILIVYNEWYNAWQQMTASENEWQRVTTRGRMSDNEWQRVTTSGTTNDNEWQRVVQRMTTSDNEWYNDWQQKYRNVFKPRLIIEFCFTIF